MASVTAAMGWCSGSYGRRKVGRDAIGWEAAPATAGVKPKASVPAGPPAAGWQQRPSFVPRRAHAVAADLAASVSSLSGDRLGIYQYGRRTHACCRGMVACLSPVPPSSSSSSSASPAPSSPSSPPRLANFQVQATANVEPPQLDEMPAAAFRFSSPSELLPGTRLVHSGERFGRPLVRDALTIPLVQTSTYTFVDTAELIRFQEGTHESFEYGRYGNPTAQVLEQKISCLEGLEETLISASGMCAATTMLLALVPPNGHIVTTTDCYRRTRQFMQTFLPRMGIGCTVIEPNDVQGLKEALEKNNVTLFFSESPTNPYLRCVDIAATAKLCHEHGALVCIDGTFATPVNMTASSFGADIVIHSLTKYMGGHNDVLGGSLSGSKEVVKKVRDLHNILGGVIDPHAAYLILRGLKTLSLRVNRQNDSAMRLALELEAHPKVKKVHYPGLASHPDHAIALKQMSGFGGVISFEIDGDLWATAKFIDSVQLPYIAPSLGGVESLIEQPAIISYWDQTPEVRAKLGIFDNLVRLSVGVEEYEDIRNDILQALEMI